MTSRRVITKIVLINAATIAIGVVLGLLTNGKPDRYFGEGRFMTLVSCAQLLLGAFFSSRTFFARREHALLVGPMSSAWVWALISAGFIFLALDEAIEIHERLDHVIHEMFQIRETALTDRLDDAIIGLYGLIGLAILGFFRNEMFFSKQIQTPLGCGFGCFLVSVVCDAMSNGEAFVIWLCGNVATGKRLNRWISVGDGAFTLLAEGFFLAGLYVSYRAAVKPCKDAPVQ